jgi:hypothetical protein
VSYAIEFETVDIILRSTAETRGVDAFALSLIKAERQIRKLFTHLVYQYPCFGPIDIPILRETLASSRRVYSEGFVRGFDALYPRSISNLIGARYEELRTWINEAIEYRKKIFHGQLTTRNLSREELLSYVAQIGEWCKMLATEALSEFGYDGFVRNSLQKSKIDRLSERFLKQLYGIDSYSAFIRQHMER